MVFDPAIHHRRSIRLRGYDYSQPGLYFVTVCVEGRRCLLGNVMDGKAIPSAAGQAVQRAWFDLLTRFAAVQLDSFVAMPNHIHGVIVLARPVPRATSVAEAVLGGASPAPTIPMPTLGTVVGALKSVSAIAANRLLGISGHSFWQRGYYEHIVRGGDDLDEIRRYIAENPTNWDEDPLHPANQNENE